MKSIGEKIADGIQKFYTAFINQRVLTTPEEVQANTNEKNLASAVVVGEIYNNLAHGQIEFDIDSDGKGYYRKTGADTWSPFSRKPLFLCTVANSDKPETKIVDLSSYLDNPSKYSANNFIIIPKSVGYYGQCYSGAGSSSYNPRNGTVDISISYDNATGNLIINGLNAGTSYNNGGFVYRGYIASFDVLFIP